MKPFWLLVLVSVSFNSLGAQEVTHAPTVEQCRADQRLWLSKLEGSGGTGYVDVGFRELNGWSKEMGECQTVDPDFKVQYYNTQAETSAEMHQARRLP